MEQIDYVEIIEEEVSVNVHGDELRLNDVSEMEGALTSIITLPSEDTKLTEILQYIPHGVLDKRITGIGATHLEMYSPRNSIIVTPTRALAYNKYVKDTNKFLYYGSAYNGIFVDEKKLISYLNNPKIQFKKFLVVADSLHKLIAVLNSKLKGTVFQKYFLMVDEVDSLQSDNHYRPVLSKVGDCYLKFNPSMRAMVSATLAKFSHPQLKEERVTQIICDEPTKRNINLIQCNNVNQVLADEIQKLINESQADKVLIAYNSINNILETLKLLPDTIQGECGILCGENSKIEVSEYETNINERDCLSKKITFMTCAFFAGIDIEDQCHLITVSNLDKSHSVLTLSQIRQIYGRCRHGILSDTIIYNLGNTQFTDNIDEYRQKLIMKANKVVELLNFADGLRENNRNIENIFNRIRSVIIETASGDEDNLFGKSSVPLTRETLDKKLEISYFNIDALCEKRQAYRDLYSNLNGFLDQLRLHHDVTFTVKKINVTLEQKNTKRSVAREIKDKQYDNLSKVKAELWSLLDKNGSINDAELRKLIAKHRGEKVVDYLVKIRKYIDYIDVKYLLTELANLSEKNKKAYRNFNNALMFCVLDENHSFKTRIIGAFKQGEKYSSEKIQDTMKGIIQYHILKGDISNERMINLFKSIFKTTRIKGQYSIKGLNPLQIPTPLSYIPADADRLSDYFII
jgi:hypothetical protein